MIEEIFEAVAAISEWLTNVLPQIATQTINILGQIIGRIIGIIIVSLFTTIPWYYTVTAMIFILLVALLFIFKSDISRFIANLRTSELQSENMPTETLKAENSSESNIE